jgi:hypothetical protein
MAKFSLFILAAVLCAASLLSCSSDSDEPSSSSGVPNSSSKGGSSSSVVSSSSTNDSSSNSVSDPDLLVKKTIKLSSAGDSYADIDGKITTYNKNDATKNLSKIDLIAYCGTSVWWCPSNSIFTPSEVGLFYLDDDGYVSFIGSEDVWFYEIPSTQAEVFKTATKLSEISTTLNNIRNALYKNDCEDCEDEIRIAVGKVFLVQTSEINTRIVIIKATGNQSVDLEIIIIPS